MSLEDPDMQEIIAESASQHHICSLFPTPYDIHGHAVRGRNTPTAWRRWTWRKPRHWHRRGRLIFAVPASKADVARRIQK